MTTAHAAAARTSAAPKAAPPVMRAAAPQPRTVAPPIASLAAIPAGPAVQRQCETCESEDKEPGLQRRLNAAASAASVQRKCAACESEDKEETGIQPRLAVGPVGDRYEMEADSIAAQVMAMRDPDVAATAATAAVDTVQRACSACSSSRDEPRARRIADPEEDISRKVRARRDGGGETIAASDAQLTSGGSEMPAATRSFFEGRMGRDLGHVRIHSGSEAQAKNDSISARAFTYKNHVWLGSGESASPSFTMAHELAHVMQQTAPGPVGPQRREASDADAAVQRSENAFWLPGTTLNAKGLHTTMHDQALKAIRGIKSNILTEVPIPGANRRHIDLGAQGRADIYTADGANPTVPGVQQVAGSTKAPGTGDADAEPATDTATDTAPATPTPAVPAAASIADLDNFAPSIVASPMEQGSSAVNHDSRRAPKIAGGRLTDMSSAPANILIGEMKPAHDMDYRKSGAKQVGNYIAGISAVADKANAVALAMQENASWHPNPKVIPTTPLIPATWDASKSHSDWDQKNLKIRHYSADKAKTGGGKPKPKAQTAKQGRPKTQPIRGRWMMAPDNIAGHEGVIVYFLAPHPTDLANALKPGSTRTTFRGLSTKIKKIQKDLITAPKASASTAKVAPLRVVPAPPLASPAPPRIARKEVKDNFKAATWEAERTGAGLAQGATDTSLLADYGAAAGDDLREEIAEQGAMVEWLKTKPPTPGTTYDDKPEHKQLGEDLSLLKSADFWTSIKARPFGILREKFGLFFVKAYEKMSSFGKTVKDKFKGVSEGKILAGKTGTILKAAAKVAAVVLPRLVKPFLAKMLDTIIDCGIRGFEAKFRELIEGTFIEDVIQTAEEMKEKVDQLATDVEAFFKDVIDRTIGPIHTEFEEFIGTAKLALDVAKMIKEITQAIRIGSCVAGLVSAPETVGIGAVVGCGFALGDYILSKLGLSPVDHLIGTILSSCEMQNKIGTLMAGLSFVKTLPGRAGMAVVNEVKSILSGSQTLKDLGSVKGKTYAQHASELFCNPADAPFPEMGYEPTDCSDTGSYAPSKAGDYSVPNTIPGYDGAKPIPDAEKPWIGTEIPKGREGQLNPVPKDKAPPTAPAEPAPPDPPKPPENAAPVPSGEKAPAEADDKKQEGGQGGEGGTGAGKHTTFEIEKKKADKVGPTPPEFRAMFVHGIDNGFNTGPDGNFDEKTSGACYGKTVKISILDTFGMHRDDRPVAVKVCKIEKLAKAPYPNTPNKIWIESQDDISLTVKDDQGAVLISYVLVAGRRYTGWLAERRPDPKP